MCFSATWWTFESIKRLPQWNTSKIKRWKMMDQKLKLKVKNMLKNFCLSTIHIEFGVMSQIALYIICQTAYVKLHKVKHVQFDINIVMVIKINKMNKGSMDTSIYLDLQRSTYKSFKSSPWTFLIICCQIIWYTSHTTMPWSHFTKVHFSLSEYFNVLIIRFFTHSPIIFSCALS